MVGVLRRAVKQDSTRSGARNPLRSLLTIQVLRFRNCETQFLHAGGMGLASCAQRARMNGFLCALCMLDAIRHARSS